MKNVEVIYKIKTAAENQILAHLKECNKNFLPPLAERVDLAGYSRKLFEKSVTFEAWKAGNLVGLLAAYHNKGAENSAYITNVSVSKSCMGMGIASTLLRNCVGYAIEQGCGVISLEVHKANSQALGLYQKFGFIIMGETEEFFLQMRKDLNMMDSKRNYDQEGRDALGHKYAYNFDFDVMHPFMLRAFIPFFIKGNLLELGSFKGDFTRRFLPYFEDVTCVEVSDEAIAIAQKEFGERVKFVNSLFETADLPVKYDNIVLTHVLEHLNDPVAVMKKINDEWLSDAGRFFLVCPNANAPSRQIAVKMGLISHNSAVTPAEKEHGHLRTYSLDTLERDAAAAGLHVVHRSGIFFKALANFQWDRLLNTDIISPEYLEGCYQLGQQYPDLCSSIFLMCEKGK